MNKPEGLTTVQEPGSNTRYWVIARDPGGEARMEEGIPSTGLFSTAAGAIVAQEVDTTSIHPTDS